MLANMPASGKSHAASHQRELKALLRLVNDLGYEVQTTTKGQWVVSTSNERGDRKIVGVDDADQVADTARGLARTIHADQQAPAHAMAG